MGKLSSRGWIMFIASVIFTFFIFISISSTIMAAEKRPIKLGFISPTTGRWAQAGTDMLDGAKLRLQEDNYSVAGRKITLIEEDEGDTAVIAVARARKLINNDNVDVIAGVFLASSAYGYAPLIEEANIPLVVTSAAADDLTQRKRSKNLVRTSWTGCLVGHVSGDYAFRKLGWKKAVVLGWEHAFGQETIGSFQRVFEEAGGRVIQKFYVPHTTLDFSPYVATFKTDADGLFEVVTQAPSIRFLKAVKASGLMDKWKVLTVDGAADEVVLAELGDTGLGVLSTDIYSAALDNPENVKFKENVRKILKREANSNIMNAYVGVDMLLKALKAVGGDVENRDKLFQSLRNVELPNSVRGPVKIDKYGMAIGNVYVRRIEKVKGQYQNTVVETYPMVSQFWKYDPETYMKAPVYSTNNPPCKYCE